MKVRLTLWNMANLLAVRKRWIKWIQWIPAWSSQHNWYACQGCQQLWCCFSHWRFELCKWIYVRMGPVPRASCWHHSTCPIHDYKVCEICAHWLCILKDALIFCNLRLGDSQNWTGVMFVGWSVTVVIMREIIQAVGHSSRTRTPEESVVSHHRPSFTCRPETRQNHGTWSSRT